MKQLLRKTYDFELELKDGRTVLFKIEQGSLRELLQMSKAIADEGSLKKWLVDFLIAKKPEDAKIEPEDFEFLMPERVVEIVDWLTRTYAKGFFARRTDKKKAVEKDAPAKAPESSLVCFLLKETDETLESLLSLTWEQIEFLLEGAMWNQNAQTKEGQKRNEREARLKAGREQWDTESAKDVIERMEARLAGKQVQFKKRSWQKTR